MARFDGETSRRIADRRATKKEIAKRWPLLQVDAATELGNTTRTAAYLHRRLKRRRNIPYYKCKVHKMAMQEAQKTLRKWYHWLMRLVRDAARPSCQVNQTDEVGFCSYEGADGMAYFSDCEKAASSGERGDSTWARRVLTALVCVGASDTN